MENNQLYNGISNILVNKCLYRRLPEILHPFLIEYQGRERDVLLISTLGAVSSCLPRIAGIYDQRVFYANLYVMVSAPAASGKGVLNKARLIVASIHKQLIKESEEKIKIWKAKQKENKDDNSPMPLREVKILAGDTSTSQLYTYANSSKDGLIMIETEADTVGNMLKNDWSSYSPFLRSAFQHEPISVVRKDEDRFIEIESPKFSLLMSGTPEQFKNIIQSKENGLLSRFLVYCFDDIQPFKNVFEKKEDDPDKLFQPIANQLHSAYFQLRTLSKDIMFKFTDKQERKFVKLYQKIHANITEYHPNGFLSNINRYALMHFRIAMILTALRNLETLHKQETIVCSNQDFFLAYHLTSTFLKHSLVLYYSFEDSCLSETDEKLLFALNTTFTRKEALGQAEKLGMPTRTFDDKLKKWKKMKVIHSVGHGKYKRNRNNY